MNAMASVPARTLRR